MRIEKPAQRTWSAAVVLGTAALLAATATACATSEAATGGPSGTPTTSASSTSAPIGMVARATSEGTLETITGYTSENGGKTLLVYHSGVNGGCDDYTALSSETDSGIVWIGVVKLAHKLGTVCPMYVTNAHLPVTVTLTAPLGARHVRDVSDSAVVSLQAPSGGTVNPGGPMIKTGGATP